jgi:threonine synthase
MPQRLSGLFDRSERYATLPAELEAIEDYIAERATPKPVLA